VELGADPERTFIAPTIPSLPLDTLEPTPPRDRDERPFTYLYVGRLVEEKGLRYLVEAIRHVPHTRLLLAGEGPLREELEATAPADRVRLYGHLDWSELQALYREADALVFPSLYDVWGLVVNEALAHGLPVIATDQVGAVDDLIEDGVNGLVVPSRSVRALAAAMRDMATWDAERRDRGAALGREKVAWYRPSVAAEIILAACQTADAHFRRNGG
jgi:glycosyltransferase involved in cell wall biosynthesis